MAKSFKTLREEMAPERRMRNQMHTELALFEMSLAEIRRHRRPTDPDLVTALTVASSVNAQTELQHDILLSTLVNFIAEMGGTLKLIAQFPDEEIVINQFEVEPMLPHLQR